MAFLNELPGYESMTTLYDNVHPSYSYVSNPPDPPKRLCMPEQLANVSVAELCTSFTENKKKLEELSLQHATKKEEQDGITRTFTQLTTLLETFAKSVESAVPTANTAPILECVNTLSAFEIEASCVLHVSRVFKELCDTRQVVSELNEALKFIEQETKSTALQNKCPICFDRQVNAAMSCGHTFCDECLRTATEGHGPKRCPTCRQIGNTIKLYFSV
jgi:Zinc finger, C3HC4 type (RING finger)